MLGKCLCEEVVFEINGKLPNFYQCHCSQCRKVTGSAANTGCFLAEGQFKWLKGEDNVTLFVKDSGYNSCFCSKCGSALPSPQRNGRGYWIPVGLLLEETSSKVAVHLHVASKASWDCIADDAVQYSEMPTIERLKEDLLL
ncbi:MAG: GFA family protein [Lentisphaeraceae bacterium]|nr:GFA family protein [Lentisphaeraceae bacterium]